MGDCICVRRGDGPEGCGICNETGTTPDIAGLCERLRAPKPGVLMDITGRLHPKDRANPDGPQAADTLERQAAKIERLREALTDALPYVVQFEDMRDGIHGAPEPNDAMQLVHEIRAALLAKGG